MWADIIFLQRDGGFESNFGAHETKSRTVLITTILGKRLWQSERKKVELKAPRNLDTELTA